MAKRLRSAFFRSAASMTNKFYEHLKTLWEVPKAKRKVLLKGMPDIIRALTVRDKGARAQELVGKIGWDTQKSLEAISVLECISDEWSPFRDTTNVLLSDFRALKLFPKEKAAKEDATTFLASYLNFLERDSERRRKRHCSGMVLPNLKRIDAVVDYRVVQEEEFHWQEENPEEFRPKCASLVPVVILQIVRTKEDPVVMQVEPEEIDMMVRELQAAAKTVRASKRLVK